MSIRLPSIPFLKALKLPQTSCHMTRKFISLNEHSTIDSFFKSSKNTSVNVYVIVVHDMAPLSLNEQKNRSFFKSSKNTSVNVYVIIGIHDMAPI